MVPVSGNAFQYRRLENYRVLPDGYAAPAQVAEDYFRTMFDAQLREPLALQAEACRSGFR